MTIELTLAQLEAFDPKAPDRGAERRFCCPLPECSDKDVDAEHRTMGVNTETGQFHCFRCGAKGLLRDRWTDTPPPTRQSKSRASARRAFSLTPERSKVAAVDVDEWRAKVARSTIALSDPAAAAGVTYLASRGIPADFAERQGVGFVRRWLPDRPGILFRIVDRAGELVAAQGRYVDGREDPKARTSGELKSGAFLTAGSLEADRLVVCEAPIDALSLALAGHPAIAFCGLTAPDWFVEAAAFRKVAIAFDADDAGDAAAKELCDRLTSFGATVEHWRPTGFKDWNEMLMAKGPGPWRRVVDKEQAA